MSGRRRVPNPPTRTTARISRRWSGLAVVPAVVAAGSSVPGTVASPGSVVAVTALGVGATRAGCRVRRRIRHPGTGRRVVAGTLRDGDRGASVDGAELGQLSGPRRLRDVAVLGHDGDREDHAVAVDADALEVGDVVAVVTGLRVVVPHPHLQLRVLVLALEVVSCPSSTPPWSSGSSSLVSLSLTS